MSHSTIWVVLIVIGAVIVAVSNIQYNKAKEAENKFAMAQQALALLQPELKRNYEYISKQKLNKEIALTIEPPFETTAWETVSNSDLLLGLSSEKLSNIMQAYYLMNHANELHAKYIESSVGVASALQGSGKIRDIISGHLNKVFEELAIVLESSIKSVPEHG